MIWNSSFLTPWTSRAKPTYIHIADIQHLGIKLVSCGQCLLDGVSQCIVRLEHNTTEAEVSHIVLRHLYQQMSQPFRSCQINNRGCSLSHRAPSFVPTNVATLLVMSNHFHLLIVHVWFCGWHRLDEWLECTVCFVKLYIFLILLWKETFCLPDKKRSTGLPGPPITEILCM